ncbi:MAG TPA: hypothetical protein VGN60_09270 [Devosia sp.]|jgi:hypothetical protein|nr:hypothetical protein [Devosia sp.]
MERHKNLFARALDALVAGRESQARAYLDRYERDHAKLNRKLTNR